VLVIANEEGPTLLEPRQRPLYHPSPRFLALVPVEVLLLLADAPDVGDVPGFASGILACGIVISLVEAQVLFDLWALDDSGVDGGLQQLRVMDVRAVEDDRQWSAVGFDQNAFLGARFGPIRRVGSGFFPRRSGPCSCTRRRIARSS